MDLRDLMNNDAAPARPSRESVGSQRGSFPPPQRSASGSYNLTAQPPPPPAPQGYYPPKPQVPPYPHDARSSNPSLPSTPMALHTPQQQFAGGQYPFPQQHSPTQAYPHMTPRQQSHPHYGHSMSPTPPGAHRSPHAYPPPQSQPTTPLGPPMQHYGRPSTTVPVPHQRSASGASYGLQHQQSIASQSPAQSMPPSAYPPESPQTYSKRPSADYAASLTDRERSLSVSPKTKVVLPTRQNSQDASWMLNTERYASNEPPPHHRGSVDQAISPLTTTKQPTKASPSGQARIGSQTPQLRNLLNDDGPHQSPMMVSSPADSRGQSIPPPPQFAHSHSQSSIPNGSPVQTFDSRSAIKPEPSSFTSESLLQQPLAPSQPMSQPASDPAQFQSPSQPRQSYLKRSAESDPERTNPFKKTKKRYVEPPVWARYAPSNPRYDPKVAQALGPPPELQARRPSPRPALQVVPPSQPQQPTPQQQSAPPPQQQQQQSNGHPMPPVANGQAPSKSVPHPVLGPWELNIMNTEPTEPLIHAVGDYLFHELLGRPDVGVGDARNGALEIEAKLGTLVDKDTNQRLRLPIMTPTVLAREYSQNVRFESFMTEVQHKCMNEFLNKCVQESMQPNRVKMDYKHRYEIDSFAPFTQVGLEALPQSAKNYLDGNRQRTLRLRTTVNERAPPGTNPVIARIAKIRLADLDIYWPMSQFDCRISINIEVDMNNRPDIDPTLIVDANDMKNGGERKKDRLSYKHLAYSVDLTQVKTPEGRKIHELEVEIDAVRLREQAERAHGGGGAEGYEALVKGLVSNVFTLMRVQVPRG